VEIFKKLAFWYSLVSPRVLSRETWEKTRARGLRTLTEYKISMFGPLCSVRITKNYQNLRALSVWIIRKIASEALGKRFDFLLGMS
jgi:hypothetical protein